MTVVPRRFRSLRSVLALATILFLAALHLWHAPPSSILGARHRESDRLERFMNSAPSTAIRTTRSSFDWAQVPLTNLPPEDRTALPAGRPKRLPRIQHAFGQESPSAAKLREHRRQQVRRVFVNDWASYRKYAWKQDALAPLTATGVSQFSGWAATLVDSLDALWIMGLKEAFDEAVAAVAEIDFGKASGPSVNIFETNIRYLGGLLAAYDLSGRDVLLEKAIELGNLIYAGFNTPNRMPVDFINFQKAQTGETQIIENFVVSASPGTLCMELTRLSQVSGNPKYYDAAARVMRAFQEQQHQSGLPGLWPMHVSMSTMDLHSLKQFTLGGNADSLYEYLPKMHALLGGLDPMYANMTSGFLTAAKKHMFFRPMLPGGDDILISGNVDVDDEGHSKLDPESEHLTCFIGGTVALAGRLLGQPKDVEVGAKLAKGCAFAYHSFASGVMPERYNMVPCEPKDAATCAWDEQRWNRAREQRPEWLPHLPRGFTTAKDPRYLLRPEAIESIFVLYRITGDEAYQETAWRMFEAVEKGTRTTHGHAAMRDVTKTFEADEQGSQDRNLENSMESFWLAETLKYFYLIFSPPDLIDLDEYVLNTEAHPFRRPK